MRVYASLANKLAGSPSVQFQLVMTISLVILIFVCFSSAGLSLVSHIIIAEAQLIDLLSRVYFSCCSSCIFFFIIFRECEQNVKATIFNNNSV